MFYFQISAGADVGEPAHDVMKRNLDQPLRIHTVYHETIRRMATHRKAKLVKFPLYRHQLYNIFVILS